jgi:hypothetical protein
MSQVLALRRVWSSQGEPLERRLLLLLPLLPCAMATNTFTNALLVGWLVACACVRRLSFSGGKRPGRLLGAMRVADIHTAVVVHGNNVAERTPLSGVIFGL